MSKFKEEFDKIEADDRLKSGVRARIREDKRSVKKNKHAATYDERGNEVKPKTPLTRLRRAAIVMAAAVCAVMILPACVMIHNAAANPRYNFSKALQVKSEGKLSSLIKGNDGNKSLYINFGAKRAVTDMATSSESQGGGVAEKSSQTNVQVEGVDEGDIVKNYGNYIYRLSSTGFSIIRAETGADNKTNGQLSKVCDIPVENFSPIEMYVRGPQLILIGGGYRNMPEYGYQSLRNGGYMSCFYYHTNVEIRVFDISDTARPVQTRYFEIEGGYQTSRIVEESNTLYFVINYYNDYYYDNYGDLISSEKRPYIREGMDAEPQALPLEDIYYFKNVPSKTYMILGAIDLNDGSKQADIKAYLSCSYITYVSGENLYTSTRQYFYNIFGDTSEDLSYIAKFSLNGLAFKGSNSVKGSPKDRYCMDEYKGYLRVASSYTRWSDWYRASAVYVFNEKMKRVSMIDDIAPGESIDSASFSGNVCSISTSVKMMDPLFIIDFTDVKNPELSEGLKEEGISNYLKLIEGSDYMLGLGRDGSGVKVQLYDMSGADAVSVGKLTIEGGSVYAEVLSNPKALLYMYDEDTMTGIAGFAAETAEYSYNSGYYRYAVKRQGLHLYSFDAKNGKLNFEAFLTNFNILNNVYEEKDGYYYDWAAVQKSYAKYIQRGVVIGGYIYTVSRSVVSSYRLVGYEPAARLEG